jgi:DNA-binding ferritin-like protein
MKAVIAAINLAISAGFAYMRLRKILKEDISDAEKVEKIRDELEKVLNKLSALAEATDPTWDDALASILSDAIQAIANGLIDALGE